MADQIHVHVPLVYRAIVVEALEGNGTQENIYRMVKHIYTEDFKPLGFIDPCSEGKAPAFPGKARPAEKVQP